MDTPNLQWHDQRPIDSERYALHAWPTIGAIVTRRRTPAPGGDYQVSIEGHGQTPPAPRSVRTRGEAQAWALRTIERRFLGQSTRLA
jgi:hypothetical protein